ncbi:MAG TPA: sigma-70 family RNA polymerase sigma factor [Alphaproteobacteria bacterium]|nr:sigma-70 family RNA polymerase sigma factor [Alphaproteobacteria bacterium]
MPLDYTDQQAYIAQIRSFPNLSFDEEQDAARRWKEHGDQSARQKLIESHLKFVTVFAAKLPRHLFSDGISVGTIGLMKAIDRFEPEQGNRLSTYARWWIRAELEQDASLKSHIIKLPTSASHKSMQKNLGKALKKVAGEKLVYTEQDLSQAADTLGAPFEMVKKYYMQVSQGTVYLNARAGDDGEGSEIGELIADPNAVNAEEMMCEQDEREQKHGLLIRAFEEANLNDREKEILRARRLSEDPSTLEELGEKYEISKERVRQIEVKALEKITAFILNARDIEGTVSSRPKRIAPRKKTKKHLNGKTLQNGNVAKRNSAAPERDHFIKGTTSAYMIPLSKKRRERSGLIVDYMYAQAELDGVDLDLAVLQNGFDATLKNLFPKLSVNEAKILDMAYLNGEWVYSDQAIAANLGLTVATVKVSSSRAFHKIAETVQNHAETPTPPSVLQSVKLPARVLG